MPITPVEQYLSLEEAVANEVARVLEDYLDPPTELAGNLVAERDFSGARQVVESIYVDPDGRQALAEDFRPRVFEAMILGARRLVPATESFVARGFLDATLVDAAVETHVLGIAVNGVENYKANLFRLIERAERLAQEEREESIERSEEVITKALSVDDIASRLNRAAFTGRPALASVGANLSTSRLTAYGFLRQADGQGVERFQITEVLDNLTCPICWRTHGQIYSVAEALAQNTTVLRTTDPDALKQVAPWPRQSRAGLLEYDQMTVEDRSKNGYNRPPFHPYCRGQLVPVGTAEPIPPDRWPDDIPKPADLDQPQVVEPAAPDAASAARLALEEVGGEDFADRGFSDQFGTDLRDLSAQMFEPFQRRGWRVTSAETRRLGESARWRLSINAVNEAGERMQMNRAFQVGSGRFGTREGVFTVNHASLVLPASETGTGIGREVLRNSVRAYRAVDPRTSVELIANIDVGNYAWARYGFKPTAVQSSLRNELRERLSDLDVPADVRAAAEEVIASDDDRFLWNLADMRYDVDGVPLGRRLLSGKGFSWPGRLDLDDAESMARFEAYVGRV